ncbi:helix-turn-helix domain-containing protein [Kribbella sp. NPDC051936]|uniref:helix-turn-helix domain-containing protein n=1 Tax=Kribbella sp. NPDC051936 TaxID=3154946 RepID=UPI00341F75F2
MSFVSRFRLYPTPAQEAALLTHCGHAGYVWNLALEQWPEHLQEVAQANLRPATELFHHS